MIELALTVPLMFLVVGGGLDLGKLVYLKQRLDTATVEAARFVPEQAFKGSMDCSTPEIKPSIAPTITSTSTLCEILQSRAANMLSKSSFLNPNNNLDDFPGTVLFVSNSWNSSAQTKGYHYSFTKDFNITFQAKQNGNDIEPLQESDKITLAFYGMETKYDYSFFYGLTEREFDSKALGYKGATKNGP